MKTYTTRPNRCVLVFTLAWAASTAALAANAAYDPMALPNASASEPIDLTVHDAKRARDIPIRVYLPNDSAPAPVVIFSHGLGGSRQGGAYLAKHWSARGYVAVFLQHPGSDTSVWRDKPLGQRMTAMRSAASLENFMARVKDVPSAIDQLERWNKDSASALKGRMDLSRIGMSGHSFGAVTTQAVSGQVAARGRISFTDPRITAAIALSPSKPKAGDPNQAFGAVHIPWMLMTGTKDISPIGDQDVASRLAVFPALPPGGKYEVVLFNAEHSAFGDGALPGDAAKRNPNHHRVVLALSTAFWDAYLRQDPAAKAWLDGNGPASVLEKEDRWQTK